MSAIPQSIGSPIFDAQERARQAYVGWQEAQARRIAAAERAARMALELKEANERLERKTHARAEQLARLKRELEARASSARAAYAQRIQALATRIRAARRAEGRAKRLEIEPRSPFLRIAGYALIGLALVAGMAFPAPIHHPSTEFQQEATTPWRGEPLALKPSDSLSLRRIP